MFSFFSKSTAVSKTIARKSNLNVEQLEGRDLMAAPVVFSTLTETVPGTKLATDYANGPSVIGQYRPTVSISPMMESRVVGKLATGADVDVVKVRLNAGQILTADTDFAPIGVRLGGSATPKLTLYNAAGQAIVSGTTLGYKIATTGDYFIGMAATSRLVTPSTYSAAYTMHVRPIGLTTNQLDPSWLQRTEGGMYAWLDGNKLHISGPVGHGFALRSNWQKVVTGTPGNLTANYRTYDNLVYIQTSVGAEVPLYLDTFGMQLSTKAGKFGDLYGEITSSAIWATSEIFHGIAAKFGDTTPFGMKLTASNMPFTLGEIGLKLGSDPLLKATGAPLNAAVPYLFINGTAGLNGEYAGAHYTFGALMFDPGDPMLYLGSDHLGYGVGLSYHGLIPFTPEKAPSQYQKTLFGHVYASGAFDLTKVTGVPLSVSGNVVLNLNANHQQLIQAPAAASISTAMSTLQKNAGAVVDPTWWKQFSIGINASLDVAIPVGSNTAVSDTRFLAGYTGHTNVAAAMGWLPDDFDLSMAKASLIYDGPETALYFRGGTNNWLKNSALEFLTPPTAHVDVDAAFKQGGKMFLDATGEYRASGLIVHGRILATRNFDLPPDLAALIKGQPQTGTAVNTTGAYIELGTKVLGANVTLKGRVQSNGNFELIGTASVNALVAGGSLTVKFSYINGQSATLTATLTGTVTMASTVRGKVTVNLKLSADSDGKLRYSTNSSLSSTAKIQVKKAHVSTSGITYSWDDVASVGIGITNEAFTFSALGYNVKINLPH